MYIYSRSNDVKNVNVKFREKKVKHWLTNFFTVLFNKLLHHK